MDCAALHCASLSVHVSGPRQRTEAAPHPLLCPQSQPNDSRQTFDCGRHGHLPASRYLLRPKSTSPRLDLSVAAGSSPTPLSHNSFGCCRQHSPHFQHPPSTPSQGSSHLPLASWSSARKQWRSRNSDVWTIHRLAQPTPPACKRVDGSGGGHSLSGCGRAISISFTSRGEQTCYCRGMSSQSLRTCHCHV
jgi:hypothetical protein